MDLKSVSFCQPTQIGTDLFTHMSVDPTTPNGTESLTLMVGAEPAVPFVIVKFKRQAYSVPLTNVAAFQARELEPVEMPVEMPSPLTGTFVDGTKELGVDVPSGYCDCVETGKKEKHFNFEKVCKQCSLPIWRNGDGKEEDHEEDASEIQV